MRILHLASGNRWTGAAAPAFAEVEALRAAGHDAHYAYVGGYKLQAKIGHLDFTHPIIEKAQNPVTFVRTVNAVERLINHHGFDVVHAHLTYDHWLARVATREHRVALARTFHARRVLRADPMTKALLRRTQALFAVNSTFAIDGRDVVFTPPPVDHRQFDPDGADARPLYGLRDDEKVMMVIGKVAKGRGFEAALETFAAVRRDVASKLLIVGHGEHRPALEAHAATLGITGDVIWAGYHEDDLAEHFRAADVLLFTARGSDEGHRAVLEAMACGTVPATYPIDGVEALLGDHSGDLMAGQSTPESLAAVVTTLLRRDLTPLRRDVYARSEEFGYAAAAERLLAAYDGLS